MELESILILILGIGIYLGFRFVYFAFFLLSLPASTKSRRNVDFDFFKKKLLTHEFSCNEMKSNLLL